MAIENKKNLPSYNKYRCMRDIVSHNENQVWRDRTMDCFHKYYGPTAFKFVRPYDKDRKTVVIDFESHKTIETLKKISKDLIDEAKRSLR